MLISFTIVYALQGENQGGSGFEGGGLLLRPERASAAAHRAELDGAELGRAAPGADAGDRLRTQAPVVVHVEVAVVGLPVDELLAVQDRGHAVLPDFDHRGVDAAV